MMPVIAKIEPRVIPTYPVGKPEKNPLFFEKRVYQGSSGKVYPVPFVDKVDDEPVDVTYQSVLLENEFIRLVILPEIGGRIFIGQDKKNDDYDFFYRQEVIKPALVGLAGPWVSGGVEFNWPQHHRPGTFMPVDVHIEEEEDGARTVWMSDHDPIKRMKGMHGIRLRPGSSLIELRARLYNRTPCIQTFLWWANVAAEVHDDYQSFFPQDVHYVADHAVRAMSSFPTADHFYYGIDYQKRPGRNDLGWYKNIPVPTSYMVCQTQFDFFGGYDHARHGGFVHVANRHIAPGKKQWTWGNEAFGWAWDRELTDEGGPYVELMAGVYTDNQPDFTYLNPYETKTFSQYWWPIQDIGPAQQANTKAALSCSVGNDLSVKLGLCVTEKLDGARLVLSYRGEPVREWMLDLAPGESWLDQSAVIPGSQSTALLAQLFDPCGQEILSFQPVDDADLTRDRKLATEPSQPGDVESLEELFLIGEHLEQYRHPTRDPEVYWNEAIRRDSGDIRSRIALGRRALDRGEFEKASMHFQKAVTSLTSYHPNPVTGEAHYFLGMARKLSGETALAYDVFYKATWDYEWRSCAYYQLATLDCLKGNWTQALQHVEASLDTNRQHSKGHLLKAVILRHQGHLDKALEILDDLLEHDVLDYWARYERCLSAGDGVEDFLRVSRNDAQVVIDLCLDYCEAGFYADALDLLELHHAEKIRPVVVPNPLERTGMTHYLVTWVKALMKSPDATGVLANARKQPSDYFFPSRYEEMVVLEWALGEPGEDPVAAYALGNFYFDRCRHKDAIRVWEMAACSKCAIPQVYRNLGIAYWNHESDGRKAADCYEKAIKLAPTDARLISEYDQLSQKRNVEPQRRLDFLMRHRDLVLQRDDATVALASLYNLTGQAHEALGLLTSRRFHPWEGGEGAVLKQYTTARILLGKNAFENKDYLAALEHFSSAMMTPDSLGEAYHPLQAKADVNYWKGCAFRALGRDQEAEDCFTESAEEAGDFAEMAVIDHSPMSYYKGLSLQELGKKKQAETLFLSLLEFGKTGLTKAAKIDYFATSLPNLLVFDEDLQQKRDAEQHLLIAMAYQGLGQEEKSLRHLEEVWQFTNSNQDAVNLSNELSQPVS